MPDFINDVGHYMNYLVTKRNAISSNISNANTPGYKAQEVTFSEQMQKSSTLYKKNAADLNTNPELYRTNAMHLPTTSTNNTGTMHVPTASTNNTYAKIQKKMMQTNNDGNSVDVTTQMLDLMKTNQLYGISINAINTQYTIDQAARGR
ncbi:MULTISPECIES: flagellar basal body rod protein FlgB [Bacillus cereus group]|uniref:flagellar basal body rod protein FlgB n=1 Tax=Bacillus cereus group TaxID=86661 RepID=UPI00086438A8|nr:MULTISPECIES: flagellar basal body rod protein FlgB [Bacillus cereus group]AWC28296.1 flagellar basal body rod protein FlgB [Bacillus cytotoxicus]AWC40319.1 flagellar basal body rod protein FlgB [Bacillus cytotoxicus]AWC48250.1 flagellar basal body rod protein FlgB [Bacillus cytotoxicus]AWC52363.1 flagellar basal body rod protein FlgB [Bacillus cytotoxicus]AWC56497.1 flagellar basal body rod protein FlgB [Bacillus cytotoxicus]